MIININQMNNRLSSYLIPLNTNQTTTYDVGNLGPGLGRAQKCGGIKPVNGIPTLSSILITESPTAIRMQSLYKQTIKNLHKFASTQKGHILSQKGMTI